ncbi:hypothetical protein DRQ09_03790 [candidate division KSB1 bacterium]|nr:MAG: hypothetical protein DRQ09_03790 [candidate division KSB1 bacterium]
MNFVHIVPFVLHLLFMSLKFHLLTAEIKRELISNEQVFTYYEIGFIYLSMFFLLIGYSIASLYHLKIYNSELNRKFSLRGKMKLTWLKFVIFGFIIICVVGLFSFILSMKGYQIIIFRLISVISIFVFSNVIVYYGLKLPDLFSGIEEKPSKQKYEKSALPPEQLRRYLKKIVRCMESEKLYLNPLLTLQDLAKKASIPSYYISQVLSRCLNKNFYDFVNGYRIEESKKILTNDSGVKKTILEVLYDVGFNSKSTFNTAFKKYTGMTPTEFIRLQKSS